MSNHYPPFHGFGRTVHAPGSSGPSGHAIGVISSCLLKATVPAALPLSPTYPFPSFHCTFLSAHKNNFICSSLKINSFLTSLPLQLVPHSSLSPFSAKFLERLVFHFMAVITVASSLRPRHSGLAPDVEALPLLFLCLTHSSPRHLYGPLPEVLQVLITYYYYISVPSLTCSVKIAIS